MAFIRTALLQSGRVDTLRLTSVLEDRSWRRFISAGVAGLWGALCGRSVPLQALLFHDSAFGRHLVAEVARLQPSTVYFDGVRSGQYATALRKRFPQLRLVCDFDDLMSRRMHELAAARQPISMGYLNKLVPVWVQRHLLDGVVGRAVKAYELRALRGAERRIGTACDAVVLVSSVEAAQLREELPQCNVVAIPPAMPTVQRQPGPLRIGRFVFIGSDTQLQNRQAIEYLVALWKHVCTLTPLYIYGKQSASYGDVPGVTFTGFVADVASAYEEGSVLLAPSFLRGGVKTKVLEAMAYGVVPVGTQITFEGIEAPTEGLVIKSEEWAAFVSQPEAWQQRLDTAGSQAIAAAMQAHSVGVLSARWRAVVWPAVARMPCT